MYAGIDVGARRVHAVALDEDGLVLDAAALEPQAAAVAAWAAGAAGLAIDAPAAFSTAPHAHDLALGRKFRSARGGEVALGRSYGVWVPWIPPMAPPAPPWMQLGFELFAALPGAAEVYPYACFRVLAGQRLERKTTAAGRAARLELLAAAGVRGVALEAWSHHLVDAAIAAVVAAHRGQARARAAACPHDGTAIWLPAAVPEPSCSPG